MVDGLGQSKNESVFQQTQYTGQFAERFIRLIFRVGGGIVPLGKRTFRIGLGRSGTECTEEDHPACLQEGDPHHNLDRGFTFQEIDQGVEIGRKCRALADRQSENDIVNHNLDRPGQYEGRHQAQPEYGNPEGKPHLEVLDIADPTTHEVQRFPEIRVGLDVQQVGGLIKAHFRFS